MPLTLSHLFFGPIVLGHLGPMAMRDSIRDPQAWIGSHGYAPRGWLAPLLHL